MFKSIEIHDSISQFPPAHSSSSTCLVIYPFDFSTSSRFLISDLFFSSSINILFIWVWIFRSFSFFDWLRLSKGADESDVFDLDEMNCDKEFWRLFRYVIEFYNSWL